MNDSLRIQKIENGYIISGYCDGEEDTMYFDELSKAPSMIARLLKIKGKSRDEISRMTKVSKTTEKKDDKTLVKLKITT